MTVRRRLVCSLLVPALGIGLGSCSSDDDSDPLPTASTLAAPSTSLVTPVTAAEGAAADVDISANGQILVADGFTLYAFTPDEFAAQPTCTDGCAAAWPPVTVTSAPVVGAGLDATMFSTKIRADGTQQLTVNGWPLYRFGADAEPGQTQGHAVDASWFMVDPSGVLIRE